MSEDAGSSVALLFYRQINPLNPERHADMTIGVAPNQSFAATTNSVPLTGIEYAEACKEYPIVFIPTADGSFQSVAVLGLENGENLFLDDKAKWQARYVPAFVRRYPFALGDNPDNPDQPMVCIDEACPWLGKDSAGQPLFVERQPSAFLQQILEFLRDFNLQSQRTAAFAQKLNSWGLLKETQAQASAADGKAYNLTGLWVVDETALRQLEPEKVQELFSKTGELAWVYFHLVSLSNFRLLAGRKNALGAAAEAGSLH
jgi:hypothetical protein